MSAEQKQKATKVRSSIDVINWQPIDTAPKDGTWVWLRGGFCLDDYSHRSVSAHWTRPLNGDDDPQHGRWQYGWLDGGYGGEYRDPTHWAKMPEQPT